MTSDADDRQLLRRWHENGDEEARVELVERTLPLARTLARRYANKGESLDDLEQVAALGLVKAIERFDLDRDVRFTTFAVPTIAGEIKRHFRDRGWMIRVPRDVQELSARLSMTRDRLTREVGRSPTVGELADAAHAGVEQVLEALGAADAYRTLSLDEPLGDGLEALDSIGGDDDGFERVEQRHMLRSGLTQREIAERIGVSQMHVSRLIRRSIESLRERLTGPLGVQAA